MFKRAKRELSDAYTETAIATLNFLLTSAKNGKKDTICDNLRTITQERNMKTRLIILFFFIWFSSRNYLGISFLHLKLSIFIFKGSSFGPFWSAKHLNLGGESCEVRTLSCSIQETYTLRKVKNQFLLFLSNLE